MRASWLAGVAAMALANSPVDAAAQTAATMANQNETGPAEGDIVVTAQKRAERLIDVPVSIAVVGGDNLRSLNLNAATDLQYLAPGLGLGDSNTARGAGFRIRGVGTNVFADGIEQSVGTVIDGVPLARAGQGLADLIDVERIEVLRGPQGMLFGRNASAGLINIVTRMPTDHFTFQGQASYGSGNDLRLGGSASGPIAGSALTARLTGYYNSQDGFVTNLANGQDLNNRKEYGVRGAIRFKPSASVDIVLRGDWSKRDNRANIWTIRALPSVSLAPIVDPRVIAAVGPENRVVDLSGPVVNNVESWGFSGEANISLGDYTLTSLTAYRRWNEADNNDADQSLLNVLDRNYGSNRLRQFSQELRIASPTDQFVSFVAGLFYYNSSNVQDGQQVGKFAVSFARAGAAGLPIRYSGLGVTVPGDPVAIAPDDLAGRNFYSDVRVRDYAAFGQATLNISPQFKIIAGGRYTNTRVSTVFARTSPANTAATFDAILGAAFAPLTYDVSTTNNNFSWRLGAQFTPDRQTNIFATVSRGYKGPGFNQLPDFTLQPALPGESATAQALRSALVNPEIPTSYEVGLKKSLANNKVSLELTFYRTDFQNFQAQVFETPPGATLGGFRIRNAGKLRTQGFEASVDVRPVPNFQAGFSVAYNDAKFLSFVGAACPRVAQGTAGNVCSGGVQSFDASGLPASNAPKWQINVNGRYDAKLSDRFGAFIQSNLYFRSANSFGIVPAGSPNPYIQPAYAIVNGTLGLQADDGRYTLSVYVKNLFNEHFVNSIFDLSFGGTGDLGQFVTRDSQRTVGLQLGVKF